MMETEENKEKNGSVVLAIPLMRQTSIYSLTLDEIQDRVCESGKTFGSMNMDELLANIWSVEDCNAALASHTSAASAGAPVPAAESGGLQRQGSITLPAPLGGKTVDQVWSDINRQQQQHHQQFNKVDRQPTFGKMTLEDFLIIAGVVRDGCTAPAPQMVAPPPVPAPQQYALFFGGGESNNGYGGSSASPVSPEGMGAGEVDNSGVMVEVGVRAGRKRMADGQLEKVVERRQRRMIKNRESAARSRARKQAYTVELESEFNHLKEVNTRLKAKERRALALRKQLAMEGNAQSNAGKSIVSLRRCKSCCW